MVENKVIEILEQIASELSEFIDAIPHDSANNSMYRYYICHDFFRNHPRDIQAYEIPVIEALKMYGVVNIKDFGIGGYNQAFVYQDLGWGSDNLEYALRKLDHVKATIKHLKNKKKRMQ